MYESFPSFVLGFHGCDKAVGEKVISGGKELEFRKNPWDWLGNGIYFWELDPLLACEYAKDVAEGKQFSTGKITTPFVIGAIVDLGNCLNLPTTNGVKILKEGYEVYSGSIKKIGGILPQNKASNQRYLDCAVIEDIHQINKKKAYSQYDTVRGAFSEGKEVYEGTSITMKNHIQICVRTTYCIKGYFLPKPIKEYNPYYE